jgi:hypothetical protein
MKPSWNDAPPQATHLAMDCDGHWYWFGPPECIDGTWVVFMEPASDGPDYSGIDWDFSHETLEQRERDQND